MKNKLLLSLIVSLFAMSAWAADVALKENFRVAPTGSTAAVSNKDWQGDLCTWHSTSVARRAGDTINTATVKQATWLVLNSRVGEKIYTTNWEGGVKKLSFKFARYGKENTNGRVLKIKASVGTTEYESDGYAKSTLPSANVAAIVSPATTTGHVAYSYDFQHKANDQLTIENASTCSDAEAATNGICRILVSDIEITPYILYRNKDVTVGLKQRGYVNNGSQDFINNTGGEGSIAFSSSNENVATVDPETGVVTPVGVGDAIITATWSEGASTTYTLHVVDGIVAENFSKVVQPGQTGGATWHGDLFDWKVANVRRGVDDTLGLSPRIQATAMRSYAGSTLISNEKVEGGIKHIAFDWRQWGSKGSATKMYVKFYSSADNDNWGEAVASQEVDAATASTPFVFNEDVTGGAHNAYLKMEYTADAAIVAVMGAMKITPYLLYTAKEATLDTRNGLTYTNNDLINNTTGDAVVYSIAPDNVEGVSIDAAGQVTVTDETEGDFTVTATWGEVTTSYTLTVVSRTATTASFANAKVALNLGAEVPANELTKTAGYDGVIAYASSNTAVATVTNEGVVSLAGGVGQATITATLPQTENYKAAEAKFDIFVEDPNALTETFNAVPKKNAAGHHNTVWDGDLFDWRVLNAVRKNGDVFPSDAERTGIWMAIPNPDVDLYGIIQSEGAVEGGIKYLSFYWEQWGSEAEHILKPVVYSKSGEDPEEMKGSMEYMPSGTPIAANRMLFGANDVMRSNSQLILKNESHKSDNSRVAGKGRFIIDQIHITPYLLYTNKSHELYAGESYTMPIINNTESGTITYSLEDNDGEASIDAGTGEVTALAAGEVTVKASWSEGAYTTYTLTILSKVVTEASYAESVKRVDLNTLAISNPLNYTEGYDGTITYSSSNTAVATVNQETGAVALEKGVGQATITATLPATDNYEAATASYTLYVRDNGARIEDFSNVHIGDGVVGDAGTDWTGVHFDWHVEGAIRHNASDTIWGDKNPDNVKVWIATAASTNETPISAGVMASKDVVEGGIKYLSFYWKQWASESGRTLRIAAFDGEERKGYMEYVPIGASTQEKFLLGVNDMMRNNHRLYIKNESFKTETFDGTIADDGASSKSRLIIDDIYITPYLLYTDKAKRVMRVGDTDKNESLINNIGADASYESSNTAVATVAADGTVTAIGRGTATITASYQWNENEIVTTWYEVEVFPVNCETFDGIAQTSNYGNTTPRVGDKATWTTSLGGFNVGDCGALTTNLVRFRAPNNADENAFIESGSIAGGIGAMTFDWNLGGNESTTEWDIRVFINGQLVKTLTNAEISATGAMNHFEQIAIEGINEPGNFVIRFENHSTISGTYPEGNKARFLIDNICWENYNGTKTLAEDTNNEGWIRANGGQTVDVVISRSPLVANVWNTLCLPFAISKSTDLDGADVKEMTSVDMEGEVLNIYFNDIEGDELQAGKPYLVKPAADKNISGTYNGKQISSIASPVKNGDVTMQGMFSPVAVTKDDYNTLFVGTPDGEGNNLFYPQADGTLRGLRAYFKIGGAPLSAPRRARYVVTQKDVVTGIESVQNSDVRIQKIIRDGQLFIIHDGKMYNAQGQVIK